MTKIAKAGKHIQSAGMLLVIEVSNAGYSDTWSAFITFIYPVVLLFHFTVAFLCLYLSIYLIGARVDSRPSGVGFNVCRIRSNFLPAEDGL